MDEQMERAGNFLPRVDEEGGGRSNEVDRRVVSLTAPASVAAEQYRTLYYRLERMRAVRPMRVVALTSAMAGEGKTVTAVNVALTAARANLDRRVLLVDADLRQNQVASALGIRSRPGLAELLAGECEAKDVIRRFRSTRLAVIPAGASPEDSSRVLASARMKQILSKMREAFDEIYLDLPPALPFADASIAAAMADGVVLVIRANATPLRAVDEALERLAGTTVVGCVLNATEAGAGAYPGAYVRR